MVSIKNNNLGSERRILY